MEEFVKLGLSESTIEALKQKGYTKPTTIQAKVIPLLLKGEKDVIGQSQTGTGKTASFALPIIEKIKPQGSHVKAIILAPTRELASQVAEEIISLKGNSPLRVLAVYGGAPIMNQIQKLKSGVDIVVGTPGRVKDLQNRRALRLDKIEYAVLDEADEMLNMGFVEEIEIILKNTPREKSMLLFSATMPRPILKIAKTYMREHEIITVEKSQVTTSTVDQIYYEINAKERNEGIRRIIDYHVDFYGIVFCNTKAAVDTLTHQLTKMKYAAASLHGDITQSQREKILQQFKNKDVKILVATDVAARGIDVNDLSHVVNFSLPQSPEAYVHRIGRTGRAGKKGTSITFVIPSERRKLAFLERVNSCKLTKKNMPTVQEIIDHKEVQIKNIVESVIAEKTSKGCKYDIMAKELVAEHDPQQIIAAVLKYAFKHELDINSYKPMTPYKASGSSGNTRGRGRGRSRDSGSRGRDSGFRGRDSGFRGRDSGSRGRDSGRSRDSGVSFGSSRSREGDRLHSDRLSSDKSRFDRSRVDRSGSDRPRFDRSRSDRR